MTVALWYHLRSGSLIPLALVFFLSIALALLGLLCFQTNFQIFWSSSVKIAISNLIVIALNLKIALGSVVIIKILILPVQEHGISFDLFVSCLIFFFLSVALALLFLFCV